MFIITGVVRTRDGGFYNLLARRASFKDAQTLNNKLQQDRRVQHVKVQTLKQWENEGMPGQLGLFEA
jgi:hypothetical protein